MMPPAYLYCIDLIGGGVSKVGTSWNPIGRLHSMRETAPFEMVFSRVLLIPTRKEADAHEAHIISNANSHRERGEWVISDAKLVALFDAVSPATDVTEQFRVDPNCGRIRKADGTADNVRRAAYIGKAGPYLAASLPYDGSEVGFNAAVVKARLADGYGAQDILVLDGIPEDFTRSIIAKAENDGSLRRLLGLSRIAAE